MYPKEHKCNPEWDCWETWIGEEHSKKVRAYDAQDAAEKYSERIDSENEEYLETRHVFVRLHGTADGPERFLVRFEHEPTYSASKVGRPK